MSMVFVYLLNVLVQPFVIGNSQKRIYNLRIRAHSMCSDENIRKVVIEKKNVQYIRKSFIP